MRLPLRPSLLGLAVWAALPLGCHPDAPAEPDAPPTPIAVADPSDAGADGLAEAAAAFLRTLDAAQRTQVQQPFDSAERQTWTYLPGERQGLALGDLAAPQREALHALLRTALSAEGYEKAVGVIELEDILGALTGNPMFRDAGRYYVTVFGTPGADRPWGWRFEGHHLSLNYTSVTDAVVATTPAFFGANPAEVPSGPRAGWRLLADEEDLGRRLFLALDADQRARALLSARAPRDILTGTDRKVRLDGFEGLPASAMTEPQRALLDALVAVYLEAPEDALVERWRAEVRATPPERLFFAWAGGDAPGEGHYYRVHAPALLIEYDNVQGGANHVHAVVRDPRGDFGEDLLRRHYETNAH
ncbi:MAG: DUF3500 domain-containing protein [Rubricoccaceae bacterium]|nr:DUF3500 domain-containing protein [Rubricoccaceae bacterium]